MRWEAETGEVMRNSGVSSSGSSHKETENNRNSSLNSVERGKQLKKLFTELCQSSIKHVCPHPLLY